MNEIVTTDLDFLTSQYDIPWDKLKDKTLLISGASGFLAAYMIETLLLLNKSHYLNVTILAVSRSRERFQKRFYHHKDNADLVFIEQDICLPLNIEHPIDFIIHAASQASPKYYEIDPVGTLSANTLGTANLLQLACEKEAEGFLYFSSAEVYGGALHIPTAEPDYGYLDPLELRSCYAESKRMGENMCVSWHHQFQVPVKIVRPFHTYGPGMLLDDGRVYADFVANVINDENIEIKSDGLSRRSFCYIADATAGFWMILLKGKNATAYNIGDPASEISIRDLAYLVAGIYPEKNISVILRHRSDMEGYLPSQVSVICPDISRVKALGWSPVTPLESGFRQTIESYLL